MKKLFKKIGWLLWIILSFIIGIAAVFGLFYLLVKVSAWMGWGNQVLSGEDVANWFPVILD